MTCTKLTNAYPLLSDWYIAPNSKSRFQKVLKWNCNDYFQFIIYPIVGSEPLIAFYDITKFLC